MSETRWEGFSSDWWWPSGVEATVTENPVRAVFYATDGSVLLEVRERPVLPFGYTLPLDR